MGGESLAVIAVILVMAAMFVRARKKAIAVLTLPLISVPCFYLLATGIFKLARTTGITWHAVIIGMIIGGVVLGAAACSLLSVMIPTRRGKTGYLTFCLIFQVAIAIGYMINLL